MTLDELCDQLRGMDAEDREKAGRPLQVVALVSSACGVCALNTEGVTVDDAVWMWARMLAPPRVVVAKGVLTEEQKAALRDGPPGGVIEWTPATALPRVLTDAEFAALPDEAFFRGVQWTQDEIDRLTGVRMEHVPLRERSDTPGAWPTVEVSRAEVAARYPSPEERGFPYSPASAAEVGPVTRLSTPGEDAIYAPPERAPICAQTKQFCSAGCGEACAIDPPPAVTPFPDEPGREPVGTDYRGG